MNTALGKLVAALFVLMVASLMAWVSAAAIRGVWEELTRPSMCYTTMTEEENLRQ